MTCSKVLLFLAMACAAVSSDHDSSVAAEDSKEEIFQRFLDSSRKRESEFQDGLHFRMTALVDISSLVVPYTMDLKASRKGVLSELEYHPPDDHSPRSIVEVETSEIVFSVVRELDATSWTLANIGTPDKDQFSRHWQTLRNAKLPWCLEGVPFYQIFDRDYVQVTNIAFDSTTQIAELTLEYERPPGRNETLSQILPYLNDKAKIRIRFDRSMDDRVVEIETDGVHQGKDTQTVYKVDYAEDGGFLATSRDKNGKIHKQIRFEVQRLTDSEFEKKLAISYYGINVPVPFQVERTFPWFWIVVVGVLLIGLSALLRRRFQKAE